MDHLRQVRLKATGHIVAVGAVLAWPVTYAIVFGFAMGVSWVGGGRAPLLVYAVSMVPAAAVGLSALWVIIASGRWMDRLTSAETAFALVSALGLALHALFSIAMLAII